MENRGFQGENGDPQKPRFIYGTDISNLVLEISQKSNDFENICIAREETLTPSFKVNGVPAREATKSCCYLRV